MNFGSIVRRAQKAASDNTPALLTTLGVAGLVSTVVLTSRGTLKAAEILREEETEARKSTGDEDYILNDRRKVELTWKCFVPAIGTGAFTIACIIAANRIQTRRAAALATAYGLSQEAYKTYKDKVLEKLGEKKEQAVRDEIAQDQVTKNPPPTVIVFGKGDSLCRDGFSGRYFESTLEDLKAAQNNINYRIIHDGYASLTDFWDEIGLPKTDESDEIGWNSDTGLELEYSAAISTDGRPCINISFQTVPGRGYFSVYG
jgi:hypothetical protein